MPPGHLVNLLRDIARRLEVSCKPFPNEFPSSLSRRTKATNALAHTPNLVVHSQYIPEEDTDDALLAQIRPPPPPPAQGCSRSNRSPTTAPSPTTMTAGLSLAGSPQRRRALPNGDATGTGTSSLSSPVRARGGSLVDGVGVIGVDGPSGGGDGGGGGGGGGRDGLRSPSTGGAARRVNVSDHHGVSL